MINGPPLAAFLVDMVAIQKDIFRDQLEKSDTTGEERRETQQELSLANRRWGSDMWPEFVEERRDLC